MQRLFKCCKGELEGQSEHGEARRGRQSETESDIDQSGSE